MTHRSRQKTLFGPASIAIHDDADMPWRRLSCQIFALEIFNLILQVWGHEKGHPGWPS
jgi:hypothetical protein